MQIDVKWASWWWAYYERVRQCYDRSEDYRKAVQNIGPRTVRGLEFTPLYKERLTDVVLPYGVVVREPGNPYDRNALRAYAVARQSSPGHELTYRAVGYVAREQAARLAGPAFDDHGLLMHRVTFSDGFTSLCIQPR